MAKTAGPNEDPELAHALEKGDLSKSVLTTDQKGDLLSLLWKYKDDFSANDKDRGRTSMVKHTIDTEETKPIKQ